eukprot:SAG11_NODE_669_length_7835_cov_20.412229_3_plen_65_part_00
MFAGGTGLSGFGRQGTAEILTAREGKNIYNSICMRTHRDRYTKQDTQLDFSSCTFSKTKPYKNP